MSDGTVLIVVGDGRTVVAYEGVKITKLPPGPIDERLRFNPFPRESKDGRMRAGVDPNTGRRNDQSYRGRVE